MALPDFENKMCIVNFKIPENDVGTIASSLSVKSLSDLTLHKDGTYRYAIGCTLLQYDINGIWIFFRAPIGNYGPQDQELFVPIHYVLSIKLYSKITYKHAKIKPTIGFLT